MEEKNRPPLAWLALVAGVLALGLAPLAPLIVLQPTAAIVGNLTAGDPGSGHPWLVLPVRMIQPVLAALLGFSAASALLGVAACALRREPRRIAWLGLFLSLVALAVWLAAWDQGFAWREFYRDMGIRE